VYSDHEFFLRIIFVALGCLHDFEETPGIAHFLEHMLFMGSEKYPQENYFHKFIAEHAGYSNGTTYLERQSYYWNVSFSDLAEGLDM